MTRIGAKTGTSKTLKNVQMMLINTDLEHEYQNLNSGSLRAKGLNSDRSDVGKSGPSPSGSSIGDRNPIRRFKM